MTFEQRMRQLRWAGLVAAAAVAASMAPGTQAHAADPEAALSASSPSTSWDGGPFRSAMPFIGSACGVGSDLTTCDTHTLDIDPTGMGALVVEMTARDDSDLDLYLLDPDGQEVGRSEGTNATERIQLVGPRPGRYTVTVVPFMLDSGPVALEGRGAFDATAQLVSETFDVVGPSSGMCATGVPSLGAPAPEERIALDVLVLLDDVSTTRANAIIHRARTTYDDAGIDLRTTLDPTFAVDPTGHGTDFEGNQRDIIDSGAMFAAARAHVGGAPPAGVEAVVVLTDKNLNDFGSDYLGIAMCIGALEDTSRSFALSEAWADERTTPIGLHQPDLAAMVFAHELGHLVNAPHHYGECTFGAGRADQGEVGAQSCTLMQYISPIVTPTVTTSSMYFSHLNRAVVRSHVAAYATD